jgi:hypothetical protein
LIYLPDTSKKQFVFLNINLIDFARITGMDDTAMEIKLVPVVDANSGLFRLKVQELHFPFSKAKIKRLGRYGKTVDLNIDIKLEAIWKESAANATGGKKSNLGGSETDNTDSSNGYSLKTATLGESSITISSITPSANVPLLPSEPYLSAWFEPLPSTALKFMTAESDWAAGWYTITITVKEVNPFGITSKQRADFFSASSGDLSSFMKQLIPQAAGNSK